MSNVEICLSTADLNKPLWRDAALWRLWCWCRAQAAARPRTTRLGGVPLRIGLGELAATPQELRQGTGLDAKSLCQALEHGCALGLFTLRKTPWGVRIKLDE